jgi:hypothetical protein
VRKADILHFCSATVYERNTNCCFANPINRYNFGADSDARRIGPKKAADKLVPTEGLISDGQGGNRCPMLTQNPAERQVGFGRSLAP